MGKASPEQHKKETKKALKGFRKLKFDTEKLMKNPKKTIPQIKEKIKALEDYKKMMDSYNKGLKCGGSVGRGMGAALRGGGIVTKG